MPADPFVVHVARLRRNLGASQRECRIGVFDPTGSSGPPRPVDSAVPAGAEATADVRLEPFSGGVMVKGTVSAPWVGVCRRCTVPVGGELVLSVKERFADPPEPGEPEDDLAYPIVDDELDLGPMLREAIVLELPLAPLCRDDCAGLCPHCGIDRNVESCDCVAPKDPRWATLDALRTSN
jgi:uncharacterized protein